MAGKKEGRSPAQIPGGVEGGRHGGGGVVVFLPKLPSPTMQCSVQQQCAETRQGREEGENNYEIHVCVNRCVQSLI